MTDTLTCERDIAQMLRPTQDRLQNAFRCSCYEALDSSTMVWNCFHSLRRAGTGAVRQECIEGDVTAVLALYEACLVPSETCSGHLSCREKHEFAGLSAILVSFHEPARTISGTPSLVLDEDSPLPAVFNSLAVNPGDSLSPSLWYWELQYWAERAAAMARDCLSVSVEPARRQIDPEIDQEWWLAILVKCRGDVTQIAERYQILTRRFVTEVPPEVRDHIRFELQMGD